MCRTEKLNEISKITKKYIIIFKSFSLGIFRHLFILTTKVITSLIVKGFEETYFSDDQWRETIDHAKSLGFGLMCTPFDENSVPRVKP